MTVPLDRLYHYIENTAEQIFGDRVIIYRFFPHGSKKIQNLTQLRYHTWLEESTRPIVWCHDQEPLDYEYYQQQLVEFNDDLAYVKKIINIDKHINKLNYNFGIFSKDLLLHSERRSINLKKYEIDNELIPVYYWSHAIISMDWFRYAEHIAQKKQINKTFLVYNRAWSGTREYRLKFTEHLIRLGLTDACQTSVNPIEPELGIHYNSHQFKNPVWRPQTVLENFFPLNTAPSHYSADFDIEDYEATDIEVVLETLFDDDRLHLTEKSLRPIACAQPFIIAGTHGSLEYLRSYGFKTFGHVWDERYDLVENPKERLECIADTMRQIANWTPDERTDKMAQAQLIADYNKKYFFSKEFVNYVNAELEINLQVAFNSLKMLPASKKWLNLATNLLSSPELSDIIKSFNDSRITLDNVKESLRLANQLTATANTV